MSERFWAGKWRKGNLTPCHFCIKYGRGARGQTLKDKFGEKITKKKTVILTWVDAVSVECCRCPQLPPRPRTEQSKTADHSWSSACREPVTVSHRFSAQLLQRLLKHWAVQGAGADGPGSQRHLRGWASCHSRIWVNPDIKVGIFPKPGVSWKRVTGVQNWVDSCYS